MKKKKIVALIASVVLCLGLGSTIAYASSSIVDSSTEGIVIKKKCPECNGKGKIKTGENTWEDCGYCGGTGEIVKRL